MDAAGNVFIADADDSWVREVHAGTGAITRVAGALWWGYPGDGGPATQAELNGPAAWQWTGGKPLYC